MRFRGKTALVTGGSRGIGRACVAQLAAEGAVVAFVYRSNHEAANSLVDELKNQACDVRALQADVCDSDRAHELVNELVDEWEHLDILVNSAGIVQDAYAPGIHCE